MNTIDNRIVILTKDNYLIEIPFKDIITYEYNISSITIEYFNKQQIVIKGKNSFNEPNNFSDRFEKCIELNHDLFIHNHGLDNQSLIMFPISIPVSNYLNIDGWFEFVEFTIIIKFETKTIKVYKDRTLMFNAISVQQAIEFCLNYNQYKSAMDINNGIDVMENYKNIMKSFASVQTLLTNN